MGAGLFDTGGSDSPVQAEAELRLDNVRLFHGRSWELVPAFGVMATDDSAYYGHGSFRFNLRAGERWVLSMYTGAGVFDRGDGKDLGHTVEFRSAMEFAYRFDDRSRLGLSVYHLSNASLSNNNPGTEVLTLHYSYPLNKLFGD